MIVLWITNILFPEALNKLTGTQRVHKASGGWMLAAAEGMLQLGETTLCVATISPLVQTLTKITGDKIIYYIIPYTRLRSEKAYAKSWKQIQEDIKPDIVHIFGTELSYGHSYLKACGKHNVVVSIQGLVSVIARYYCAGISPIEYIKNSTFHDILRGGSLSAKKDFYKRGRVEEQILREVQHIIGRTSWDKTWATTINPQAEYHFCNEILRGEFYDGERWNYDKCNKHTIFLSQGSYPIKGLHQVLLALPQIRLKYPDVMVRIAGLDITQQGLIHTTDYGKIIKKIIKNNSLEKHVEFVGMLDAGQMKQEFLSANVFICPSSIENSPNSLGEAQILGVPVIASYVGGIPDMMVGNEENMYRFEEVGMLAERVCSIFASADKQISMVDVAIKRHSAKINVQRLQTIYNKIVYK